MPYKNKDQQRKAQAESQRRRYRAPDSRLREYYAAQVRTVRAMAKGEIAPAVETRTITSAKALVHRAGLRAFLTSKTTTPAPSGAPATRPDRGYDGTLKLNHF